MSRPDILSYDDVVGAAPAETGEALVAVSNADLLTEPISAEKAHQSGPHHVLRISVASRLYRAASELKAGHPSYTLLLLSSYRNPAFQERWHAEIREQLREANPAFSELELSREANQRVAAPEVAGHTCGAAVDVAIVENGTPLDMGCGYLDFRDPEVFKVFSLKITPTQAANRAVLREVMLTQGFAPFNGEWWHFSYGDREWAAYYGHPASLYSAIPIGQVFPARSAS